MQTSSLQEARGEGHVFTPQKQKLWRAARQVLSLGEEEEEGAQKTIRNCGL